MTRPCKCRHVAAEPRSRQFKPCGVPFHKLQQISLTLDELEAVRLADLEGLYQEEAAGRMNVSRQTFGNIINSAHAKIADTLVNAKLLKIEGGAVQFVAGHFRCDRCRNHWQAGQAQDNTAICPKCHGGGIPCNPMDTGIDHSQTENKKEKQP